MTVPEYDTKFGLLLRCDSPLGLVPDKRDKRGKRSEFVRRRSQQVSKQKVKTYQRMSACSFSIGFLFSSCFVYE